MSGTRKHVASLRGFSHCASQNTGTLTVKVIQYVC